MNLQGRIEAFSALGDKIRSLGEDELSAYARRARADNHWFTEENVKRAFEGIAFMLNKEKLEQWVKPYSAKPYSLNPDIPRVVGIVMAGNIPMVGFHDLLCVLISGHFAAIKTSSQDSFLMSLLVRWLEEIEPRLKKDLSTRDKLTGTEAVIATGSDNTSRYFEFYFKHIPRIIRKNRTSVAVLSGHESAEDLKTLGKDIFWYFGLGCRNVSKVFVPKGYKPDMLFEAIEPYKTLTDNHKYKNNYDYYKSIFLINRTNHLDTGFLLWLPTRELVSPVSVLYAEEYETPEALERVLDQYKSKIQCVVGRDHIPFGSSQFPELWDYADDVDTLKFLSEL